MRDGWRVSLDRLPLPLLPLNEGSAPTGWEIFLSKRSPSQSEASAFARPKAQADRGLLTEGPDGGQLDTDEIRRRLSR
jgi:hypothetical protein